METIRRLELEATHLKDQRDAAHATRARQNLRRHLDTQHAET